MKTVKQWLEELPEPYRTQALENINGRCDNEKVKSQGDALINAFVWNNTPQGFPYWNELHEQL